MGIDARERVLQRAQLLASLGEDEKRFNDVYRAWANGDRDGFLTALKQIPMPGNGRLGEFGLWACLEFGEPIRVERLVWAASGKLFDSVAARAALEGQKFAPALSDTAWAAVVQWLIDLGILEIHVRYVKNPDMAPLGCNWEDFGPAWPPLPGPPRLSHT